MNPKKTLRSIAMGAVLLASGYGTTHAASIATPAVPVILNVPDTIILHYISSITINVPSNNGVEARIDEGSGTWSATGLSLTASSDELATTNLGNTTPELSGALQNITIPNVWAVRGFSPTGTASVSIAPTGTTLTHSEGPTGGEITIINQTVKTSTVAAGSPITVPLLGIKKTSATIGDVNLTFNFDNAIKSGAYSGGGYYITGMTL